MTMRFALGGFQLVLVVSGLGCASARNDGAVKGVGPSFEAAGAPACVVHASAGINEPIPLVLRQATVQREKAPPAISGGTLLASRDGKLVIAADPERDQVYFVSATEPDMRLLHTHKLQPGDEPGRVVEDAAGRFHVVLRGGHAIATFGPDAISGSTRREVCALPRGIAYDSKRDQLHVACAEGKLVTLGAAPAAKQATRTVDVAVDARDVLVRDDKLFVTRFRAAELLVMNADGVLLETRTLESFRHDEERAVGSKDPKALSQCGLETQVVRVEATPNVAWRAIDVPKSGVVMLHQRSHTEEIATTEGGYGRGDCKGGIVATSLTKGVDTEAPATAELMSSVLAVDIAAAPDGQSLAVVAPGNHGVQPQLQILSLDQLKPRDMEEPDERVACTAGSGLPDPDGQVTAVTFVSPTMVAVQQREPAAIHFYTLARTSGRPGGDVQGQSLYGSVTLTDDSTLDTGHALFHSATSAGVACASCHPEAGDDGHVWTFEDIGPRRTQTLRGGLLGTEPFHWNGDMQDFSMLMREVFVGRMSGFEPNEEQASALVHWLDRQPALHADSTDGAAAERGKLLFESPEVGCSTCHSGTHLTNNTTANVNTGADLQVPSLKGVRFRAPLMHDGCAADLHVRLTNPQCGGGDNHGKTSHLDADQLKDLVSYLETL